MFVFYHDFILYLLLHHHLPLYKTYESCLIPDIVFCNVSLFLNSLPDDEWLQIIIRTSPLSNYNNN